MGIGGGIGTTGGGGGMFTGDAGSGCDELIFPGAMDIGAKGSDDYNFEADEYWGTQGAQTLLLTQAWGVYSPSSYTFSGSDKFKTCYYCVAVFLDCTSVAGPFGLTAPTSCGSGYFAQGGTLTLDTTSGNTQSGTFAATLQSVTLEQWNFTNDTPIFPPKCITVPAHQFNLSWP